MTINKLETLINKVKNLEEWCATLNKDITALEEKMDKIIYPSIKDAIHPRIESLESKISKMSKTLVDHFIRIQWLEGKK